MPTILGSDTNEDNDDVNMTTTTAVRMRATTAKRETPALSHRGAPSFATSFDDYGSARRSFDEANFPVPSSTATASAATSWSA